MPSTSRSRTPATSYPSETWARRRRPARLLGPDLVQRPREVRSAQGRPARDYSDAGGLGTTAVQLAKTTTGARVIVLDIDPRSSGSLPNSVRTRPSTPRDGEKSDVISEVARWNGGRGADAVIDFVGNPSTSTMGFEMLDEAGSARDGRTLRGLSLLLAAPLPAQGRANPWEFHGDPRPSSRSWSRLAGAGAIRPVVSSEHPLEDANSVLQRLERGEVMGRAVLRP